MATNNYDLIEYITIPPKTGGDSDKTYEIADKTWRESPLKNTTRGDIARWNSKTGNYIAEERIGQAYGVAPLNENKKIDTTYLSIGVANGLVPLNENTENPKIDTSYLPSFVSSITPGVGLTTTNSTPNNPITNTGTLKVKLKNENLAINNSETITNVAERQYAVVQDAQGYLSVNVPWTDTGTGGGGGEGGSSVIYSAGIGISISGTSIKVKINDETSLGTIGTTPGLYPVGIDANGKLCIDLSDFTPSGAASYSNGNLNIG